MVQVIIVNEADEAIGQMEKMEAHEKGILHRAFSIFVFNSKGEMLLQQRAHDKYHSAGLWTNTCCSHPEPGETVAEAANRRLQQEMGFTTALTPAFNFIYKTSFDNGLTEHELDHVFVGEYEGDIDPNPAEAAGFAYMPMQELKAAMAANPDSYTEWFKIAFPRLEKYLAGS